MKVYSSPPPQAVNATQRRAKLDTRVRADLWSAVWEATQTMTYDQIRECVEGTLREVESDAP